MCHVRCAGPCVLACWVIKPQSSDEFSSLIVALRYSGMRGGGQASWRAHRRSECDDLTGLFVHAHAQSLCSAYARSSCKQISQMLRSQMLICSEWSKGVAVCSPGRPLSAVVRRAAVGFVTHALTHKEC
jgi:hypothetical protein